MYSSPKGILALSRIFNFEYRGRRRNLNVASVLFLTFVSYCVLHACRKALPVVKNKLQGTCGAPNQTCTDGFAPFNEPSRSTYFTILDLAWAFSYAVGMLFMGHAAEMFGRKIFLFICLFGTGLVVIFFGLGYYFDIHLIYYYIILQILNGVLQSAGWPTIISIVSSWVSKATMGSILGIWGNHYAVGNIMGQTLSAVFVDSNWGMAFVSNGLLCIGASFLVLLFLASKPDSMGFHQEVKKLEGEELTIKSQGDKDADSPLSGEVKPISFGRILFLPGVLEYSFSLFFIKIVTYTFLFWLPYYIKSIDIKDYAITASTAGYMASMFDVGGIVGNIVTGILLDLIKMGGTICFVLQIFSCFTLYLFATFGHQGMVTCVS